MAFTSLRPTTALPACRAGGLVPRAAPPRPVRPARAEGDSVDDAMKAADALLAAANGGTPAPRAPAAASGGPDLPPGMQLQCDVNGCSIVALPHAARAPPPAAGVAGASFMSSVASMDSSDEDGNPKAGRGGGPGGASGGPPRDFELAEGAGWRLGVDRSAPPGGPDYCAVVGGDGWSAALTRDEYDDLVKLLRNLQKSVATLHVCGDWQASADDDAALEMSTAAVWAQARAPLAPGGKPATGGGAAFEFRFILLAAREFEAIWPAAAVAGVLGHLDGSASVVGSPVPANA